jgi:hypothetical protein
MASPAHPSPHRVRGLYPGGEGTSCRRRSHTTVAQAGFRFALDVGMVPLTGTADPGQMRADLGVTTALAVLPTDRRLGQDRNTPTIEIQVGRG